MRKTFILIGLLSLSLYALPQIKEHQKIIELYEQDASPQRLLEIGQLASKMEIDLEKYKQNSNYAIISHLQIVKSENYGDFIAYDGYHFKQIIHKYPHSDLIDDAVYYLINISDNVNNFTDLNKEKQKLQKFLKTYPKSNLAQRAKERIEYIENHIKSGGMAIYD